MLFLRQDEIWSLCQWQLKVHCQHNRSSCVIGDSSKFFSSYKANKIKSRVMWLWGKSRPCAVHTSAFSRVWLNHHGNNHSSLEPAVRWPLMLCSLSSLYTGATESLQGPMGHTVFLWNHTFILLKFKLKLSLCTLGVWHKFLLLLLFNILKISMISEFQKAALIILVFQAVQF